MDKLKHFLILAGEGEKTELRGIAMDAVGTFAEVVGKEAFHPYFVDVADLRRHQDGQRTTARVQIPRLRRDG